MTLDITLRSRLSRFLPPDLLDRLPEVDALAEAIRRLGGLYKTIGSFVPGYVADDERLLTASAGMLRPGAFLFADVSGFTALSEKLQLHGGEVGAEILTLVINDYFSTMLEILAKSDGQLLKFAGDALLAFFPGEIHESASKAIRTGLRMQRAMTRFQPIQTPALAQLLGEHDQRLSMSIGISHGQLLEAYVGNSMQRDHLIQGRLPGSAMAAEGAGDRDDVIVTPAMAQATANEFQFVPVEGGFLHVLDTLGDTLDDYEFRILARRRAKSGALFDFEQQNLLESLRLELERVENVSRFMAPAVLHELVSSGGDHLQSQNRIVVTLFIHVTGFADMLERWGEDRLPVLVSILERYYSIVQRVISVHGGSITRSDPYQLGMKMLITFGAPVSNPDDAQRAVTAALEMQRQLNEFNLRLRDEMEMDIEGLPIQQRIGITLGVVFAGEVGWRARREYTVMGDDVNLSARLMSKAAMGQTLISDRVWRRTSHLIEATPVEPLQLKGKSQLIQAYAVTGMITRPVGLPSTSDTPFTGRESLFSQLSGVLNALKETPTLHAIRLVGESGVGKTRLARELASAGETSNFKVAWATCSLKTGRRQTWASIVSQLLRIDLTGGETARQALKTELAALELSQLEPAFAELLFEAIPPSEPAAKSAAEPPKRRSIFDLAAPMDTISAHDSGVFKLAGNQLSGLSEDRLKTQTSMWKQADIRTSPDEAVVRFLRTFTRRCPTLIIIDDAHRENPQALHILQRVVSDAGPMALLLLVAHEPTPLALETTIMDVNDLSQEETALLTAHALGVNDVGPRLRRLIWTRTNGRPLYVESLLQALAEQNALIHTDGVAELADAAHVDALPEDVRKLVISRVDRLTPTAQTTLRAAAVLGEQFDTQALWAVTGAETLEDLEATLRALAQADMIEPAFDGDTRFRHGMTQRAIYESMPRLVRQKLHRTAAEYWSRQAARPLVVAHHWLNGGMPLRAIETINAAAEAAESKHDTAGAIELYSAALDILPSEKSWQTQIERLTAANRA
jgi:class 3 adenylate cyclase